MYRVLPGLIAGCLLLMASLPGVAADAFPGKPITLVVTQGPGSGSDVVGRLIAGYLSPALGQPVVVETIPGAGGSIAQEGVQRAAPDGYTILITIGGAHVLSLFTYKTLPYHPINDFSPITAIADTILGISASAAFAPNTLREAIEFSKKNRGLGLCVAAKKSKERTPLQTRRV